MNPQMTDLPRQSRLQAPIATDAGLPSWVIRLRTPHAMHASTLRPVSLCLFGKRAHSSGIALPAAPVHGDSRRLSDACG